MIQKCVKVIMKELKENLRFLLIFFVLSVANGTESCLFPEFNRDNHGSHYVIKSGQPTTVSCHIQNLSCHILDTAGCNLDIDWIVHVKSDNYLSHSLFRDHNEEVVQSIQHNINTHKSVLQSECGPNVNTTFSVSFTDIGPHEEVLVSCGLSLKRRLFVVYSSMIVLRRLQIFSHQSRSVTTKEGDDVTITCTRSNGTHAEWEFLFSDGDRYLYTENATKLKNMGFDFYDSNSSTHLDNLQNFSVVLTINIKMNGMIIRCAAKETEDSDPIFNSFEDIIIVEKEMVIFSHQARNVTTKEGDDVTITCARSNGTYAEWEFLFSDGDHYLYTENVIQLENMGFDFYDSRSSVYVDNLRLLNFSVAITVDTKMDNMKIRCAAKETEESDPIFNSFEDIIIIDKAPGLFDGLSDKAVTIITTPLLAVILIVITIAVILLVAIIFVVNNRRRQQPAAVDHECHRGNEQNDNDKVNEAIARRLESAAHGNNPECIIFVNQQ